VNQQMAKAHREALMAAMDGGVALFRAGPERIRNRDTHFRFRPDSDFWYLTGFREPDAVAVLLPHAEKDRYILFVRPRDPEMETWNGRRAGIEGARELYGADAAFPIGALDTELPKLLRGAKRLYFTTGHDADFDRKLLGWLHEMFMRSRDGLTGPPEIVEAGTVLHEQRLFKSAEEVAALRRCAELTNRGHRAAMGALREGVGEWELEALIDGAFRGGGGWGTGYPSIVAGGANATVLHYNTNNERVGKGACLLVDAGAEADGYTADVTRCAPASGRFSPPQRELYDLVLRAQLAALAEVRPGNTFVSVHDTATRVLIEGMLELGLLAGSVDEALASGSYKRCYMHRTSHWLGLDVHDVGTYFVTGPDGTRRSRPLEPGMVLTVEPGLYVAADDESAPPRLRGIGIRIEDDVLVTAQGHDNLTRDIPKTVADVEAAVGGSPAAGPGREPAAGTERARQGVRR
jgi:Xaa-Pro aminopeptidase